MSEPHSYKVRYSVEPWDRPRPADGEFVRMANGVTASPNNFGYTDVLFLASILLKEDGEIGSILLLDSSAKGGLGCNPKVLRAVRDMIDHHLEHHT